MSKTKCVLDAMHAMQCQRSRAGHGHSIARLLLLLLCLQGGNVAIVQAQLAAHAQLDANLSPIQTSPSPDALNFNLIPELKFGGQGAQNRSAAQSRNGQRVQVGPGQTIESLAEDIQSGRVPLTDLDK